MEPRQMPTIGRGFSLLHRLFLGPIGIGASIYLRINLRWQRSGSGKDYGATPLFRRCQRAKGHSGHCQQCRAAEGIMATTIGILVAFFGASGVFGQLQDALNTIWGVKPRPNQGIWNFLRARFLSFAMVGGVCFLLLVSLTGESLLKGLHSYLQSLLPGGHYLGLAIFYVFDVAIIILVFAMLFRFLPEAKIAWHDVWTGAALTAILFMIGKFLLSTYLSSGAAGSAYGAASSLITLLVWIFYSAQILLFGAEFTKIYANACGSHVEPAEHAVKVQQKEIELPRKRDPVTSSTIGKTP
jgi:membrane protein